MNPTRNLYKFICNKLSNFKAFNELRKIVKLSVPLCVAYLGNMMIGIVDTAVVGRLGEVELAAVGLGSTIFFATSVIGLGIMLGLDPLLSQAIGAKEELKARHIFWQGMWIALAIGTVLSAVTYIVTIFLQSFDISLQTIKHTTPYILARLPGVIPFLIFVGARSYLQSHKITRPIVFAMIAGNVINIPTSIIFVFGGNILNSFGLPSLPIPQMGSTGAGIASTLSIFTMVLVLLYYVQQIHLKSPKINRSPDIKAIKKSLKVGMPIGLQLVAEIGVFTIVTILAAKIGTLALAGHEVAIILCGATYMIPLGIATASSVRVGIYVGRHNTKGAKLSGMTAITFSIILMSLFALIFLVFPKSLASLISNKQSVIEFATPLLFIAAIFQLSDAIQAVATGALRGAGDTKFPMYAHIFTNYFIALPIAYYAAFRLNKGVIGLWWGLCAGLILASIILSSRFIKISSRPIKRV